MSRSLKARVSAQKKRNQTIDIGAGMDFARGRQLFDPYQI
jgi:hypothetical protein